MDRQKNEIDEILNSLDGLQRANANPFLFEKIKDKLASRTKPAPDKTVLRWALAGALFLVINVATWTVLRNDTQPTNALNSVAAQLGFSNSSYQY
jgi:hypothetical protein